MRGNRLLKTLDRYLGIPGVIVLGALASVRKIRGRVDTPRRICILRTAAIGDTILLLPIVEAISSRYSTADVVLALGPSNSLAGHFVKPGIRVIRISAKNIFADILVLRKFRFDLLVDFGQWPRYDAILAAMSGAAWKIGFRTSGQARHYAYDVAVDHRSDVHEYENFRALVASMKLLVPAVPSISRATEGRPLSRLKRCIIHMWAGGYKAHHREWAAENWKAVVSELVERGYEVVLTGGKTEAPKNRHWLVWAGFAGQVSVIDKCGVNASELETLINTSALVLSVNTGIAHLAAALGAPTICLSGPTSIVRWGVLGERVWNIEPKSGGGFLNLGFEYFLDDSRNQCMDKISVSEVMTTVRTELGYGDPMS